MVEICFKTRRRWIAMRFMLYGLLVVFSIELAAFEVEGSFW